MSIFLIVFFARRFLDAPLSPRPPPSSSPTHPIPRQGKKYVVLFFYPLDFTFVCPTEITAFDDRIAEFEAIDTGETEEREKMW